MDNNFNVQVGAKIKKARKEKKMSMKRLGELVNLHESTISRYEKGEIMALDIEKLKEFAKVLDISSAYLMGWEENAAEDESVRIGKNIKSIRTERNISLMELSEEIHIDLDTLIQYEKGIRKIPLDILKRFAVYFNTTIDNLMGIELEAERRHVVITDNPSLNERYKKWQEAIGYNHFTDEEIDKLIDYAKYLISQRKEKEE